jgi:hypothetical protein
MLAGMRASWVLPAILAGFLYLAIGRATAGPTTHVRAVRLAAWLLSAGVFAGHLVFERLRLRFPPLASASHVAFAVAFGAAGLAVAAMIHSVALSGSFRPIWWVALVAWPLLTGVPAFLVAFLAARFAVRPRT